MVNSQGAQLLGNTPSSLNLPWQAKAWRFYGAPDNTIAAGIRSNQGAIGEVRFVMGWVAQQIGRVSWRVSIDGEQLSEEESDALMASVANRESTIIISTNLIVAGEFNYVAIPRGKIEEATGNPHWEALAGPALPGLDDTVWMAISVIANRRTQILEQASLNLRAIWPHPAQQTMPDPPLRSVLDVLEEIEQLQDLAYSQNRSRIAQMGILTVANEFDMAVPGGDFGTRLEEAINTPIIDPRKSSAAPILLRGPFELMTGALSNGARAVQWTKPVQEFDDRIDDKMRFLINRLAWGFPVAPEILLGMTATNRAVAFQIEESTYRSHVEPIANLVGRVYAGALALVLENENAKIEVVPDATELLARRHSVADAKDAYDRGLVGGKWVREVLGISEEDAATQEDIDRILLLRKGSTSGQGREMDPSEVAGNEPVRASAGMIADTRAQLAEQLAGALSIAHSGAVMRVGAAARTRLGRQTITPEFEFDPAQTHNRRLPSLLGPDRITELSVNLDQAMKASSDSLIEWWEVRLGEEQLCPVQDVVDASCDLLAKLFVEWSTLAVTAWPIARVSYTIIEQVLDLTFQEVSDGEDGADHVESDVEHV